MKTKGAREYSVREIRKRITELVDFDRLKRDLDSLEAKEYVSAVTAVLGYILPKLTSTQVDMVKREKDKFQKEIDRLAGFDEEDE